MTLGRLRSAFRAADLAGFFTQTVKVLPSGAGLALLAPARDEADLGTALSRHIGRLLCRATERNYVPIRYRDLGP